MANENTEIEDAKTQTFTFTYDKVKVTIKGPVGFAVSDASSACEKALGKVENGDADPVKARKPREKKPG